jgi:nucleoside-diphosphate-sugar epimerase
MKAIITGGLGQIGSHVAELLIARGDHVLILDDLSTGRPEHMKDHPNLEVVIDTVYNRKLVYSLVNNYKPDVIIHAAASFKNPDDWYNDTLTNCVGGINVIQAAKDYNVKRFIYFQTSLCYGQISQDLPIKINQPRNPSGSSYAISKTTNELYLELAGIDYVSFRLANVIGQRNVAGPLPIFYKRLKEGKVCYVTKSKRDFVYVKDLAKIVLQACDGVGYGPYHFSTGNDVAIVDLYNEVLKQMDIKHQHKYKEIELGEDDVFTIKLDPSETFEIFGIMEFTPLNIIVKDAIKYYKEYGVKNEYTHLKIDPLTDSKN